MYAKPSQPADFFVREQVALTHTLNNNNAFWLELSNAFDCVSQKENIFLNTENKRIIGVLTGLSCMHRNDNYFAPG
jgi:Ni2+-binding GTPase involved in maturation of urease and hydrogenase